MIDIKYGAGNHLIPGATPLDGGVNFTLHPGKILMEEIKSGREAVRLILYKKGTGRKAAEIELGEDFLFGGVYSAMVFCDWEKFDYSYIYRGEYIRDSYAKSVRNGIGIYKIHKNAAMAGAHAGKKKPRTSAGFIYKLHVKSFTKDISSGVKNPGTFAGLEEKLGYIKDIGACAIELMPAYDFDRHMPDSIKKINYWGYCGGHYFAPCREYTAGDDPAEEFRHMVDAAHNMDIRIIMEFYFVPGTGTGFILDCLRYWAIEFGIDGIHVNPEVMPMHLITEDDILSDLTVISYEHMGGHDKRMVVCDDSFMNVARRFIRGDDGMTGAVIEKISERRKKPEVINYLALQGTMSVMDMVSYDRKHNENNGEDNRDGTDRNYSWNCGVEGVTRKKKIAGLRIKQIKNAFMLLFMSPGLPLLYSGDEMGHTCFGNNNPYCQDNAISRIDYGDICKNREIYDFVVRLAAFRRDIGLTGCAVTFHGREPWNPESGYGIKCLGVMYVPDENRHEAKNPPRIYVMYNMSSETFVMDIPVSGDNDEWEILMCTDARVVKTDMGKRRKSVLMPDRSSALLVEKIME